MRDFGNALAAALLSIGLMLGALSISLVGFIPEDAPLPTQTTLLSPAPVTATNTSPPTTTLPAGIPSPITAATQTVMPPTSCPPPAGWVLITAQAGETLDSLAAKYGTNSLTLISANCLPVGTVLTGKTLYVPPLPTSTIQACNPGAVNWFRNYVVRQGDTFFNIAPRYGVSAKQMQDVNCHPSDIIYPGDMLWVPNVPTRTPTHTPPPGITFTVAPYLTPPFTFTVMPLPFTATVPPTQTPVPATSTSTVTPIPTQTASPTAFPTASPTTAP